MPVLFRIAVRNLVEHKAKTLIVGILIALGIAILVVGNSMLDTTTNGMEQYFTESYTGDLVISGDTSGQATIFGYQMNTGNEQLPTVPDYKQVYKHVNELPSVKHTASQVTGYALVQLGNEQQDFVSLWGVNPDDYWNFFNNIEIVEGKRLQEGKEGILLSEGTVKNYKKEYKVDIEPGYKLLLNSFGSSGFKIREVPVRGIFKPIHENQMMDRMAYIDVQSARSLMGMVVGSAEEIEIDEESTSLLSDESSNTDSMFGDSMVEDETEETGISESRQEDLLAILGDTSGREAASKPDSGAWHFIFLRLKDGTSVESMQQKINTYFTDNDISARAFTWEKASGMESFLTILRVGLNGAIAILAIVAIIIIMNTLVISVIDRTSEIGTMRALGAQKGFVFKLFTLETLTISIVFGLIGILLGSGIIGILNVLHIESENPFFLMMFGGPLLQTSLSVGAVSNSVLIILLVGFLASLYPVRVALKVQPIKAIHAE